MALFDDVPDTRTRETFIPRRARPIIIVLAAVAIVVGSLISWTSP